MSDLDLFPSSGKRPSGLSEARAFRLILLRRCRLRREGSLAAALTQSMALAVTGTAGAYPSWVLVQGAAGVEADGGPTQVVLGAAWAVSREDPLPGAPLLGPAGGPLMLGMAFCCLFGALSGSLALALDFLGWRRGRSLAPLAHGLTAVLVACAAALGSCLLAVVRGRVHAEPALAPRRLSTSPGQSLFLAFLACALASTATGLSCASPARVEPARSSWDFRARDRPLFARAQAAARAAGLLASSSSSPGSDEEAAPSPAPSSASSDGASSSGAAAKVRWTDQDAWGFLPKERAFKRRPPPPPPPPPPPEGEGEAEQEPPREGGGERGGGEPPPPGEEEREEAPPSLPARAASSLQRYWASSWSLLGSFGSLFQGEEPRPRDEEEEAAEEGQREPPQEQQQQQEEGRGDEEEEEEAEAGQPRPGCRQRGANEALEISSHPL